MEQYLISRVAVPLRWAYVGNYKEKRSCYFGSMGIWCRRERANAGGGCASTDFSQLRLGKNRTSQCRETGSSDRTEIVSRIPLRVLVVLLGFSVTFPALAGFNASAPKSVRRIFTQLAFAEGRLVSYHVLEPGPATIQAFPTSSRTGVLLRFPGCPGLRPVLDDSAAPSASAETLVPDSPIREVFDVTLPDCGTQPTSAAQVQGRSSFWSWRSLGFVNAPGVPAPLGANVPLQQQQCADELWGPVPNAGIVDLFAGPNLSPQHIRGTTLSGIPVAGVQQPQVRRPRIKAYSAGQLVYFISYETRDLSAAGLVSQSIEDQWARTGFPYEQDLFFLAYGRAPLPPNANLPAGTLDSNGVPNDNQAVLNVVKGAPFWQERDYSPLWKMNCLDGGITPTIGPGAPCGDTRFYQVGQPHTKDEVRSTGLPLVNGIFQDINCPILATDVNDDGVFSDNAGSKELVTFPDIDWDGDGLVEDGIQDPDSTLQEDPAQSPFLFDGRDTTLIWCPVTGQSSYDVIRGNLASLHLAAGQVDLGTVICLENDSADTTTAPDHIDRDAPQTGQGFFYLVRFAGTYGSSSSGLVRVPSSGDCP